MEKNYNKELDFVLEELISEYEKQFKGIKFYTDEAPKIVNEEVRKKTESTFNLKDWEVNLLFHQLLVDQNIVSIEPLVISLGGLLFKHNGGYTQRDLDVNSEKLRIKNLEEEMRRNSLWLMLFTALLAIGTAVGAWDFAIEIWQFYHVP
jgi:hypothetical protein